MTPAPPQAKDTEAAHGDELSGLLRASRGSLLAVAAFSGFVNLLMLSPAIYMLQVYDRVLASRNATTLLVLTVLVVMLVLFLMALETVRTWVLVRVGAKLDAQLNARVFTASFERNLRQPGSNTLEPIQDLNTLRQSLTGPGLLALFDAPWLPVYLVVIFAMAPLLGWLALFGSVVLLVLALVNERAAKPRLEAAQRYSALSQQALGSHLRNAEVIEAMGMLPQVRQRWFELHRRLIGSQAGASDVGALLGGATKFVRIALQSLVLGAGALLVLDGQLTAGMMIAASILAGRALAPVEQLVANWKQIVSGRQAYRRLAALLDQLPERVSAMALPRPKGRVTVEAVTVVPPGGGPPILRNLNFGIAEGDVVAVIGPSASGKSSLARILVGVWAPAAGSVRLDGASIATWDKAQLGPCIGYLPQDVELFDGTVAENIARLGSVDPEEVVRAARRVDMHEQILRMAQGYDTPVGADGSKLSGGQRQRIGLARALYGAPELIVLDEPNSNLDEGGEKALAAAIGECKARGKTVVVVTHRPAALAAVDKVIVLSDGTMAAYGPRDEVLRALQQSAAAARLRVMPPAAGGGGAAP